MNMNPSLLTTNSSKKSNTTVAVVSGSLLKVPSPSRQHTNIIVVQTCTILRRNVAPQRGVSFRVKQLHYQRYEVNVSDHRPISAAFNITVKRTRHEIREKKKAEVQMQWTGLQEKLWRQGSFISTPVWSEGEGWKGGVWRRRKYVMDTRRNDKLIPLFSF
ncbi:hypothetical protein F5890DRAFT_197978 [Lentinula detonsa]|uniref:DNase I-like protein n=1 Tax=Lentinula detonsa TaxID=2804962 RepID=A0AA38PWX7_9AGAR|nr:hypothetical protein F5890DRAFT_197978 [Lentinula detonsa]